MMKKPFWYALAAALYIIAIVLILNSFNSLMLPEKTVFIPMMMLSLFVLSAAIMGFLFVSEPLRLFLEHRHQEALAFFTKVIGIFAVFVIGFFLLFLFSK